MEDRSLKIILLVASLFALAFSVIGLYNVSLVTDSYNASDKYVVLFEKCTTIAASFVGLFIMFGSKRQKVVSLSVIVFHCLNDSDENAYGKFRRRAGSFVDVCHNYSHTAFDCICVE